MARLGIKIRESVKAHGLSNTIMMLRESRKEKKWTDHDLSYRELAASFLGDSFGVKLTEAARRWAMFGGLDESKLGADAAANLMKIREAYDGVDASAFFAITGQLLVDRAKAKYELSSRYTAEMFDVDPVTNGNLSTEREPGLSRVSPLPTGENVQQNQPYKEMKFSAQYIDKPAPEKFGGICRVNIEAVISDKTRQINESADSVGENTAVEEEFRKLRVAAGHVNPFSWNGTAYNTYLTAGAWINSITDTTFVDWNSINAVEQLFANMVDPVTGYPIRVEGKDILSVPALKYPIRRALSATELRSVNGNYTTLSGQVLDNDYRAYISSNFKKILVDGYTGSPTTFTSAQADTVVLIGDFPKAFSWRQVWPVTIYNAPPQSPADFDQDIILQIKASAYGVAYVRDPRYVVRMYDTTP